MLLQGLLLIDAHRPPAPGWIVVADGRIVEVGEGSASGKPDIVAESGDAPLLICPGFIDAHLHLPQIESIGCDGLELLEWLDQVIFPAEMKWADEAWALRQIQIAYGRLLRAGTLGFAAFLTSHFHGYIHVVRTGQGLPLRAVVGQVLMDRNAPPQLMTENFARIASSQRSRVSASVNPRFAPACSDQMLAMARSRMTETSLVHTHLAESHRECELVRELFPNDASYTALYDRHSLLTPRTLLAHGVHLSTDEWQIIAQRQSVVVHCPTANVFLKSGLFDLASAKDHNVRLALGSDIAAGPDIAMPRVARAMIETAKMRAMTIDPAAPIPSPAEAWQLITRGNAEALGWHDAGRIEIGAAADLLALRLPAEYIDQHLIGRVIYTWRDAFISHRIVAGRLVDENP
jgi:guanine deaminase